MEGLTEGRIVHFVMPDGKHAPAMIVKVWNQDSGMSNLQVFTDGSNALPHTPEEKEKFGNFGIDLKEVSHGHIWMTSRLYSDYQEPGTWHWIEKA
jgi:hypothetical protein